MPEHDAKGSKNWTLGVTALASFMMALDVQVITTAFATIRRDFGASVETLQWTVNSYNLAFAVLLLDQWRERRHDGDAQEILHGRPHFTLFQVSPRQNSPATQPLRFSALALSSVATPE